MCPKHSPESGNLNKSIYPVILNPAISVDYPDEGISANKGKPIHDNANNTNLHQHL